MELSGVTCKVLPGDNKALVASDPARFYMPAYVASKGWVGLRLDIGEVDWEKVKELIMHSYMLVAPKRLAAAVQSDPPVNKIEPVRTCNKPRVVPILLFRPH